MDQDSPGSAPGSNREPQDMQDLLLLEPLWAGSDATHNPQGHHQHFGQLPHIEDAEDIFADLTNVGDVGGLGDAVGDSCGQSSREGVGSADDKTDAGDSDDDDDQKEMVMVPSGMFLIVDDKGIIVDLCLIS